MTRRSTDLVDLTPRGRVAVGGSVALLGLLLAWRIQRHPEGLHAPMWVAMCACASFVISGVSMALHPFVSTTFHRWLMVALLGVMGAIPLWIALGPGDRSACRSPRRQHIVCVGDTTNQIGLAARFGYRRVHLSRCVKRDCRPYPQIFAHTSR